MERLDHHFLLLQINDSLFPIGGYSHSYGLETYIQKGIVQDLETAEEYIRKRLSYNFLYTDLLAARLAYEAAERRDLPALDELEDLLEASRIPQELREASQKLGSRFMKTLAYMGAGRETAFFDSYLEARKGKNYLPSLRLRRVLRLRGDPEGGSSGRISVRPGIRHGDQLRKNHSPEPV